MSSCAEAPAEGAPRSMRWQRLLAYVWASPCSLVGLLAICWMWPWGASASIRAGVLEVHGTRPLPASMGALQRLPFAGLTLGHVVLARSRCELDRLRVHERAHVAQYERWGPIFFVAYPLSSLICWAQGRRAYQDNHFEVQARTVEACAAEAQHASRRLDA